MPRSRDLCVCPGCELLHSVALAENMCRPQSEDLRRRLFRHCSLLLLVIVVVGVVVVCVRIDPSKIEERGSIIRGKEILGSFD